MNGWTAITVDKPISKHTDDELRDLLARIRAELPGVQQRVTLLADYLLKLERSIPIIEVELADRLLKSTGVDFYEHVDRSGKPGI